jgi:hypothetical protein
MSKKGHSKNSYPTPVSDCFSLARVKANATRTRLFFNRRQASSKPAKKPAQRQSGKRR